MSNKKYNPAEVLHLQQQNSGNNYNPRTAGEFWKIKKRKISIGDNQIDTVRTRFKENNNTPFFVSRSKVDLFLKCPRCFYFVMKYGFREPGSFPLSLNNLVDACVKNDMDYCRSHDRIHPVFTHSNLDLKPYNPEDFSIVQRWRDDMKSYIGATYLYEKYNWLLCGIIDDVMINNDEELVIIDFKSTTKHQDLNTFDEVPFSAGLKIQLEWYNWLFLQKGFSVDNTAYLVYYNAVQDKHLQHHEDYSLMRFRRSAIPVECELDWIEPTIDEMYECLKCPEPPKQDHYSFKGKERNKCDQCAYLNMYSKLKNT